MNDITKVFSAFASHGWRAPLYILSVLRRRWNAWRTRRAITDAGAAQDLTSAFSLIYNKRWWDAGGESASGPGSTLQFTQPFRIQFQDFLSRRKIRTLLDAPCGDWNWMKEVQFPENMNYVGGDIVPQIIERLRGTYRRGDRNFILLDITRDDLPEADLWLCRDCLAHLSYADVRKALENFARSKIPYALVSNYIQRDANVDIASGGFRALDLRLAPFYLPEPAIKINDWPDDDTVRQVCLWSREEVASALADAVTTKASLRS